MNIANFLLLLLSTITLVLAAVDVKKSRLGSPDLIFNREVTLSDAEQYFYKNIFRYLDDKFKTVDAKLLTVNVMNRTLESLRTDISSVHATCSEAKQSTPVAQNLQELDFNHYRIFSDYEMLPQFHDQFMVNSMFFRNATSGSYYMCISQCEKNSDCLVVVIKPNECHLYSNEMCYRRVKLAKSSSLFNDDNDQIAAWANSGLTYYWPISNNTRNVMSSNSLDKENFVDDIISKPNSAIRVTSKTDYVVIKESVNLRQDFTITMWVRVNENRFNQALFDFGNGQKNENIIFYLSQYSLKPTVAVYNRATRVGFVRSTKEVSLDEWHHYAITLNQKILSLYVDGVLADQVECSNKINDVARKVNYIGRSSWKSGDYSAADFDQIKIFNRTVSIREINEDMLSIYVKFYQKDSDQVHFTGVYPTLNVYTRDFDSSLISYWPISGHTENMITGVTMDHKDNYVADRFNRSNSAIRNTGEEDFMTINEELQLSSQFTIMFWAKVNDNKYDQAFLDFGNGEKNDNIVFYLSELNLIPIVSVYNQENQVGSVKADASVVLNKWYHYAVTMNDLKLSLFVNGALIKTYQCTMKLNDNPKMINYIGRSSWISGDYASADFDEIKVFNRSLSQQDINNDMFNKFSYIMEV